MTDMTGMTDTPSVSPGNHTHPSPLPCQGGAYCVGGTIEDVV